MSTNSTIDGKVRPMTRADLDMVLAWRNHPDVRRYMYTSHEIGRTEHSEWFARASADPERHLLLFERHGVALGFVNLHRMGVGGISEWGFYLDPEAEPGAGAALGRAALDFAFETLACHKVCGQALAFNQRSIAFHLKLGFGQEGVLGDQHFDGGTYYDVICFGLLAEEWGRGNERR